MSENEDQSENGKKGFEVKDWVILGIVVIAALFMMGYFKGNASNFKLKTENERLRNDIRYMSVLATTLVEMREKENALDQWVCEERLNQGYLNLYKKLNLKSESTRVFRSKIEAAMIEKAGLVELRNEKAVSYNEYAKSFNWEEYKDDLYNIPKEIQMIE